MKIPSLVCRPLLCLLPALLASAVPAAAQSFRVADINPTPSANDPLNPRPGVNFGTSLLFGARMQND
ncbi:MAG: hypothetical protein KBA72_14810, partial [Thermoanaerobaculia bacterium]|nr:hypothetical protein [Thermoanaerobaculia bacterium]